MCTIGLDMNAPQHSFPHIPFNFNSLIELATLCTHPHHAEGKRLSLLGTRSCAGHRCPPKHPEKNPFNSLKPETHSHILDREILFVSCVPVRNIA